MRWFFLAALALVACTEPSGPPTSTAPPDTHATAPGAALAEAAVGQMVYVPAYSHVYSGDRQKPIDLATTLSIRNTDVAAAIRLVSVRYVGSEGQALRSYLSAPRTLAPLATADFVVDESDRTGGSGASFLVEWTAATPVASPVVEAVMISTAGQQGISFVTEGRVVVEVGR